MFPLGDDGVFTDLAGSDDEAVDWEAVAAALQGATVQYWLLADLYGGHPTGSARTVS